MAQQKLTWAETVRKIQQFLGFEKIEQIIYYRGYDAGTATLPDKEGNKQQEKKK